MKFAEKLMEMVAESLSNAPQQIGQELGRMGVQGSAELAGALFNGSAFVPYGRGQNPASMERGGVDDSPSPEVSAPAPQMEHGGREM